MAIRIDHSVAPHVAGPIEVGLGAVAAGIEGFQEARQPAQLPSNVLTDKQAELFGPSSEFTTAGQKLLNDDSLTREEKHLALGALHGRNQLKKPTPPTMQEKFDDAQVSDALGRNWIWDGKKFELIDGDDDKGRAEKSKEDAKKRQAAEKQLTAQEANEATLADRSPNEITPEAIAQRMRDNELSEERTAIELEKLRGRGDRIAAETTVPQSGQGAVVPDATVPAPPAPAPAPEEDTPQTLEDLAQRMVEYDRATPEQRQEILQGMNDEEIEMFLEALPKRIKDALDRAEADGGAGIP